MSSTESVFERAMRFLLKHEGGYVDDPNDEGGCTKYGLSLRYLKSSKWKEVVTCEDVKNISFEEASEIYRNLWWEKNNYHLIDSIELAIKVFDISVNIGAVNCNKKLQAACNRTINFPAHHLTCDGIIGPMTLLYLNKNKPKSDLILAIFCDLIEKYYRELVNEDENKERYLNGWLKRLADQDF